MITCAAVKIYDMKQDKEVIIPCHRHCDAFLILHDLHYIKNVDFKELAQGFLDENDSFLDRVRAYQHARICNQIQFSPTDDWNQQLYSEDLW